MVLNRRTEIKIKYIEVHLDRMCHAAMQCGLYTAREKDCQELLFS